MTSTPLTDVGETIVVDAPPEVVFDLIADPDPLPCLSPAVVYAERQLRSSQRDSVTVWSMTPDERVWSRTQQRSLDRSALRITFRDVQESGLAGLRGAWVLRRASAGRTEVTLRQDAAALVGPELVERAEAARLDWLRTVGYAAEHRHRLAELVVDFRDPLFVAGPVDRAYQVLYEADRWPERLSHVSRVDLTEDVPNVQFFDMDTTTQDGASHTTRSVRLCFPPHRIVYKQIGLPALLDAHTGHWLFTETRDGVIAESRHVAVIKPTALPLLGEGSTVPDARRYLRRVLSANSMTNLRLAKDFAEGRPGA